MSGREGHPRRACTRWVTDRVHRLGLRPRHGPGVGGPAESHRDVSADSEASGIALRARAHLRPPGQHRRQDRGHRRARELQLRRPGIEGALGMAGQHAPSQSRSKGWSRPGRAPEHHATASSGLACSARRASGRGSASPACPPGRLHVVRSYASDRCLPLPDGHDLRRQHAGEGDDHRPRRPPDRRDRRPGVDVRREERDLRHLVHRQPQALKRTVKVHAEPGTAVTLNLDAA